MISSLLLKVVEQVQEMTQSTPDAASAEALDQIATLQVGVFRPLSAQLRGRFAQFGAWLEATHAEWLSLADITALWEPRDATALARQKNLTVLSQNWPNDATALFRADRISVFALGQEGTERIYLLWFDSMDEPELWVYDTNGEAHYRDLQSYLEAYLTDDLSAYEENWLLGNRLTS
jgi:hypothetical protein